MNTRIVQRWALVGLLMVSAVGCRSTPEVGTQMGRVLTESPGEVWVRTELYFGMDRRGKEVVSEKEFEMFLESVITPRFPAGLTVVTTRGQWQQGEGITKEASRVVILMHPGTAMDNMRIEEIRARYAALFEQDAVMRVDSGARVSF